MRGELCLEPLQAFSSVSPSTIPLSPCGGGRTEICRTLYNRGDMLRRKASKTRARTGPKRGEAARTGIEQRERKIAERVAEALKLDEGIGKHLRASLDVIAEVCELHAKGKLVNVPNELQWRASMAGVDAARLWHLLNNPDATREKIERAKAGELIEAARQDRRAEIDAALRLIAEDDKTTGIRAAANVDGTGSEQARLRCEVAAMEPGEQGKQAAEVLGELRQIEAEEKARRMALRVEIEAEADADSLCEPCPETIRAKLEQWQKSETWSEGRGPSAEDLRRILGRSRQAISAAARRGRWNKAKRGRDKSLTPGQVANVLRDYAKAGGKVEAEAIEAARILSDMSACLRK